MKTGNRTTAVTTSPQTGRQDDSTYKQAAKTTPPTNKPPRRLHLQTCRSDDQA